LEQSWQLETDDLYHAAMVFVMVTQSEVSQALQVAGMLLTQSADRHVIYLTSHPFLSSARIRSSVTSTSLSSLSDFTTPAP
jgi:hypothetical protein